MTDFRPPWARQLDVIRGIPVRVDPEVPAGTAVLDIDPNEPRRITQVRTAGHLRDMQFTEEQVDQVRDHYRAMDERAGRMLAEWQQLAVRFGLGTR